MLQRCPICNGKGYVVTNESTQTCSFCKGARVVNDETGLPPETTQDKLKIEGVVRYDDPDRYPSAVIQLNS